MFRLGVLCLSVLLAPVGGIAAAPGTYPGLQPECWGQARNVHAHADYSELLGDKLVLERVDRVELESAVLSPNGGYRFAQRTADKLQHILIDAEQPQLLELRIADAMAVETPRWINEKLLFLRIWWGTVAMTDLIVDVEAGSILYSEHATHGQIAMDQAREGCATLGGCAPCPRSDPPASH